MARACWCWRARCAFSIRQPPPLTEIAASPTPDAGDNPSGLAFSLDSLRAYVLSGSSNSVTVFDLIASAATGIQIAIPGGVAIAAAPNNQIYVTASDGFYEIDSITGTLLARIKLDGLPGKAAFTPDGKYALVANQPPFNAAGLAFLIDLDARTLAGTLPSAGANAGLALDQLAAVDNTTFYGVSTTTRQLVRISLDPSNARDPLTLAATGFPLAGLAGVRALAVSGEQPQARYIYVATADSLSRVSLGPGEAQDRSLAVEPAALQLAGAASVATPAGYAKFNDGQTVAAGSITQRLVLRAWDNDGLPVFNKTVQFSTQAAGVTIETPVSRTTSEGYAGTRVIAPETPGQRIRVDVRLEGWSGDAISFTVTVAGGGVTGSGGLEMYSGNGQVVLAGQLDQLSPPGAPDRPRGAPHPRGYSQLERGRAARGASAIPPARRMYTGLLRWTSTARPLWLRVCPTRSPRYRRPFQASPLSVSPRPPSPIPPPCQRS